MMDLTKVEDVKTLQSNLHGVFDTPQGKEVMRFLEESCGWYTSVFDPVNRDATLVNDGRRQVVSTLKTLLLYPAETIVAMAKQRNEQ